MYPINRLRIFLMLYAFVLLESSLFRGLRVFGAVPDISVVYVIFFGLFCGPRVGLEVGLAAGFFKDVMGVGVFGADTLLFGLVGLVCGALSEKVYRENVLTQVIAAFVAGLVVSRFHFGSAAYSAAVSPFIFILLERVFRLRQVF